MNTNNIDGTNQIHNSRRDRWINQYISKFEGLIDSLSAGVDNVVLGGAHALYLHGLEMSRMAADLDLIIYKPTIGQEEILKIMSNFDMIKFQRPEPRYPGERVVKAIKLKKDDFFMDIIIEEEPVPEGLLIHKYHCNEYKIQSISNTIAAKRSYIHNKKVSTSDGHQNDMEAYVRRKDIQDFIDLKNMNFNLF